MAHWTQQMFLFFFSYSWIISNLILCWRLILLRVGSMKGLSSPGTIVRHYWFEKSAIQLATLLEITYHFLCRASIVESIFLFSQLEASGGRFFVRWMRPEWIMSSFYSSKMFQKSTSIIPSSAIDSQFWNIIKMGLNILSF